MGVPGDSRWLKSHEKTRAPSAAALSDVVLSSAMFLLEVNRQVYGFQNYGILQNRPGVMRDGIKHPRRAGVVFSSTTQNQIWVSNFTLVVLALSARWLR